MDDPASALEQFRQQWKEEVSARTRKGEKRPVQSGGVPPVRRKSAAKVERPVNQPPERHPAADIKDEADQDPGPGQASGSSSGLIRQIEGLDVRDVDDDDFSAQPSMAVPKTALEHFEKAVEKESTGNLGDSLHHYRKAYKLDAQVDQQYKNKHFAERWKAAKSNPSNAAVTVPNPAHHSSEAVGEALTTEELVQSFADCQIQGAEPIITGDRLPPCTIQELPTEVLVEMLHHIGSIDPALLARLALTAKTLAYHIFTENAIWKRIALGPEFGLAGQQYKFATDVRGRPAILETLEEDDFNEPPSITELSFPKDTLWRDFFHTYPRIRFSGIYISTVNYTRAGGASASQTVWSTPVHIITYYRYLRFFRDGTCISLLTTNEPIDVVHHLTPENLNLVRSKGGHSNHHPLNFTASASAMHPPNQAAIAPASAQNTMKHALRGRWRLGRPDQQTPPLPHSNSSPHPATPTDLHIETEGAGPKYMYTMSLSLKSTSTRSPHATKNNKLIWQGFWSYNHLTDDWAEFSLKNDKPFYFSRVKRYGLGY